MMRQSFFTNWEVSIVLPLGVVDSELRRIEEQLRVLNMKALDFGRDHENGSIRRLIDERLEGIRELLGSIVGLVSDIEADIQPSAANSTVTLREKEHAARAEDMPADQVRRSHVGVGSRHSKHKSFPDQDD